METSENFDNVELTPQEAKKVLDQALAEKKSKLRAEAYWKKLNEPVKIPNFSAETYAEWCIGRWQSLYKTKWIETPENKKVTELLSQYFTDDKRFEDAGYSFGKGILLVGSVGVGKTTQMQLFSRNPVSSFIIYPCRKIAQDYAEAGSETIDLYTDHLNPSSDNPFRQDMFGICFDDLGTERSKKNYGNELNVMEEILLSRYEVRKALPRMTHITTNLSADMIEEKYGERVRSRVREMFNVILFEGDNDMRI